MDYHTGMVAIAREPFPSYLALSSAEAGAAALRTFWRLAEGWKLTPAQVARLDAASDTPPIYPYWHQRGFSERNPAPV